jgi:hypothetical protein
MIYIVRLSIGRNVAHFHMTNHVPLQIKKNCVNEQDDTKPQLAIERNCNDIIYIYMIVLRSKNTYDE